MKKMHTSKTATELLHTQINVEESTQTTSSTLQLNEEYEGSGIYICGSNETGYAARLGNYRITEIRATPNEVHNELSAPDAATITRIVGTMLEMYEKVKQTPTALPKN